LNRIAGIYFQRDDAEQAARFLARSLMLRERIGDVVGVARLFNNLGLIGWKSGDLTSALENFDHAFKMQSKLGDVEGIISLHTNMGLIELDLGDLPESEQHFQEALALSIQIGHFFHVNEARMHLALLNVYTGDWRRALEHGQLGLTGFQELGIRENLLDLYVSLGWAYLGLGDTPHLEEIIQHIREIMADDGKQQPDGSQEETSEAPPTEGRARAYRLFGHIASGSQRLENAREAFLRSADIFSQLGNPMERARVQVDLAALLGSCGDRQEGQHLLGEARSVFERMGAKLELERLNAVRRVLS
jgi:tetratricopeptide (TPR) repeat protein